MRANRLQLNSAKTEQLWCAPPQQQLNMNTYQTYLSSLALTRYSRCGACGMSGYTSTATYPWGVMSQKLPQTVSPPSTDSEVSVDWSVSRSYCHWSWRDLIMTVWLWLVFPVTCCTVCSPYLMLRHVWSVTHRSTTTSHIFSGTSTGCEFRKKYSFDWPYSFSAAVTWRSHTSSVIFNGLTKRSRCDDYGPALSSGWSYLERDSEPWVTAISVWWLLVHGTVFQPVSLQLLSLASFKRQLKTFLFP